MNRRRFCQSALAMTATSAFPLSAPALETPTDLMPRRRNPLEKRTVGLIGAGWYGKVDLLHLLQVENAEVVSICDVDSDHLAQAAKLFSERHDSGNQPQTYKDYRQQLDAHQHDLIIVGTPDHWHALPTIAALKSGASVYCEKPTACDVMESQAMLDAARQAKTPLQIGTQRRRIPHLFQCKQEVIDKGLLGDIAMVEMCCYYHMRDRSTLQQKPDMAPPKNLDWEMWTGPAALRPYNGIVHPKGWRAFMEYGNGIMGDMCVHVFDMVRWMLGLGWPSSISSSGGILVDTEARANIPDTQLATFEYPDLKLIWTHRTWGSAPDPDYQWGATFYGTNGTLKAGFKKCEFIPKWNKNGLKFQAEADLKNFPSDKPDEKTWNVDLVGALGSRNLMKDWLDSIDKGRLPVADIEQAHISSASCLLANLALQQNVTLKWDPKTRRTDNDAVNQHLVRPYREPWKHPGVQ